MVADTQTDSMQNNQGDGWLFVLPWGLEHAGGVNVVVKNLYQEFERDKLFTPYIVINSWGVFHPVLCDSRDFTVYNIGITSLPNHCKAVPFFVLRFLIQLPQLLFFLRRKNIKVINIHYVNVDAWMYIFIKRCGLFKGKIVASVHGTDVQSIVTSCGWSERVFRWMWKGIDRTVSCSKSLADDLRRWVDVGPERIESVHNGVSCDFSLTGDTLLTDNAHMNIVNVGTFEQKKGQVYLIKACAKLRERFPTLTLTLVGRNGPVLEELKVLAHTLSVQDSVEFIVDLPHDDVWGVMRRGTIFVLPSLIEPFGIVILEAACAGLPVIASKVGGVPEIIEDGVDGLLVEAGNVEMLEECIVGLLLEPGKAKEMTEKLREKVQAEFSWGAAYKRYVNAANT